MIPREKCVVVMAKAPYAIQNKATNATKAIQQFVARVVRSRVAKDVAFLMERNAVLTVELLLELESMGHDCVLPSQPNAGQHATILLLILAIARNPMSMTLRLSGLFTSISFMMVPVWPK